MLFPIAMAALNSRHALTFVLITVLIDTIGLGIIMPVTPGLVPF